MVPVAKVRLRFSLRAFAQKAVDFGEPFMTVQGRGKKRLKRSLSVYLAGLWGNSLRNGFCSEHRQFLKSFLENGNRMGLPQEVGS